jgi:hypothetical protein
MGRISRALLDSSPRLDVSGWLDQARKPLVPLQWAGAAVTHTYAMREACAAAIFGLLLALVWLSG